MPLEDAPHPRRYLKNSSVGVGTGSITVPHAPCVDIWSRGQTPHQEERFPPPAAKRATIRLSIRRPSSELRRSMTQSEHIEENSSDGSWHGAKAQFTVSRPPSGPPPHGDSEETQKWYVRLCLRADHIAKLWVHGLTPHNVLVWSEESGGWVPLLVVPDLRKTIAATHDKRLRTRTGLRVRRTSSLPPIPALAPPVDIPKSPRPCSPTLLRDSRPEIPPSRPPESVAAHTASHSLPPPRWAGQIAAARYTWGESTRNEGEPSRQVSTLAPTTLAEQPPAAPPTSLTGRVTAQLSSATTFLAQSPATRKLTAHWSAAKAFTAQQPVVRTLAKRISLAKDSAWKLPAVRKVGAQIVVAKTFVRQLSLLTWITAQISALRRLASRLASTMDSPHVERLVWMASGVGLACLAMFLGQRASSDGETSEVLELAAASITGSSVEPRSRHHSVEGAKSGSPEPGTIRVEDLPKDSSGAHSAPATDADRTAAATIASKGRSAARRDGSAANRVEPARVDLSSPPGPSSEDPPTASQGTGMRMNAAMARSALVSAASRAQTCAKGAVSGQVQVTFAPTGFVQSASLAGLQGNEVRPACVLRTFQEVRISPFTGDPVTVRKSF